jgi:cleavage stimulation factor subunit 3
MADDAELAFLRSQEQEYDPSGAWPAADNQTPSGEEEYDPASIMDTTQEPDDSEQLASKPNSTTDSPPAAEDQGENGLKPVSTETSAVPTPAKQPRTIGGFVDESEDEEEEPVAATKAAPALLRASEAAETPQRSITNTPNNTLPTPDVQLHSAQDQGVPSVSASVAVNEPAPSTAPVPVNGTTPFLDATKQAGPLTIDPARQATASVTPAPPSASLPKARLPQDRIGILNDRIQEDPRGDIEAWLGLIDEQRKRHKYDEARDVFNRFLEQFPTAVRMSRSGLLQTFH